MTYTYPPEEYARQLHTYYALEKLSFSPEDSRETILRALEERSAKKREIADVANTMIREYIETFEADPEAMTAEFQAHAGTQYGPEAAAALSVPAVRDRLEYLITEGRRDIYYRIYAFNKL